MRVLTNNLWVTGLIILTAIVSCCECNASLASVYSAGSHKLAGGGLGVAIAIHFVKYYTNFDKFNQTGTIWLISTALCDSAIAIALTWHLVRYAALTINIGVLTLPKRRHKTGFQHTDDVLNKIIRRMPTLLLRQMQTVETGYSDSLERRYHRRLGNRRPHPIPEHRTPRSFFFSFPLIDLATQKTGV